MEATTALAFSGMRRELARSGLGGSDAAAALGLNSWRTPMSVWMDCTGRSQDEALSEAAEWGTRLEPEVLRKYAEGLSYPHMLIARDREGRVCQYDGDGASTPLRAGDPIHERFAHLFDTLYHPDLPHLFAHIDGLVVDVEALVAVRLVDGKTAGHYAAMDWGEEGTDETPEAYIVQAHDYAGILALNGHPVPRCDIPALFAGQRYRTYEITISPTLYRRIHQRLDDWWNEHVVADAAPAPTAKDNRLLGDLYPQDDGESVFASDGLVDYARALGEYRDMEKEAKDGRASCEAKIKAEIGEASEIVGEGWRCTWKKAKDTEAVDYEAVVTAIRAAIGLRQDHELLDALDEAIEEATTVKPGSRRLLTYGLAKTAGGDDE